jgi:DNA-binding transcriptional regulator YiaG
MADDTEARGALTWSSPTGKDLSSGLRAVEETIMANRMTAKAFVGSEIRRARDAKGISRAKLAKPLLVSESLIEAWESGRQGILPEHMRRLIGVQPDGTYGQPLLEFPPEFLIRMVEALVNGETSPEWEDQWLTAEECADCLSCFDTYLINGVLQCPEYMQEILGSEDSTRKRQERQQRFLCADSGRTLIALMSESVLRTNVGGPETMVRQMTFLAECAEFENVMLHIVPMRSRICAKFRAPFMIAALDNGREIANIDDAIKGTVVERLEDVVTLRNRFNQLRAEALRKSESIDLVRRIEKEWTV